MAARCRVSPISAAGAVAPSAGAEIARTEVGIRGEAFLINGRPTYEGRTYGGMRIEGLLLNSRMVQGIFDDLNPETRHRWVYPDTGTWDPDRNTREFIAAMATWRSYGLLAFTINLQGGSPEGYSDDQPWHNSAIALDGSLRPEYMRRLARILDRADELGMVAIVGYFYFGQDQRLKDEAAVRCATVNATDWLLANGYRNVLVELNNECHDINYHHEILKPARIHELIELVKSIERDGRRLLVGTSYGGGLIADDSVASVSDFLLLHGNGVSDPDRITGMVEAARRLPSYRPMPILFNEDDHFDFEEPVNNMMKAIESYASWGYFDPGLSDYRDGYQVPPINWALSTKRKHAFFHKVRDVTSGSRPSGRPRKV